MFCSKLINCALRRRPSQLQYKLFAVTYSTKMDYREKMSESSKRREPSVLRELTSLVLRAPKGTISLATGMPNPRTFPFSEMNVTLKTGETLCVKGKDLESALQYQPSTGYAPLRATMQDIIDNTHGQQDWNDKSILITTGSMEGLSHAFSMLLNTGDPVILQNPLYSGIETVLKPYQLEYVQADQDADGVVPDILEQTLQKRKRSGAKMPKVMYLNPTGSNPTGATITTQRKQKLYQIAQEYDLIILEDDAYFFLHFLEADPVSMLSLDTEGRVIRFDSFSKVLSSGLRLGIVTGPSQLLRQMELHIQASTLHTSSISQVIAHELLKKWGLDGLQEHFQNIRKFYKDRRDITVRAAEKHLQGLAEWSQPSAGMFLWLKVLNVQDTRRMVMERGRDQKIFLVPGQCFNTDPQHPSPYIRAAFSIASPQEIDEGMSRLATLIREEWKMKKS